ncbi:disease resistance protein L6-like [Syzygium oleosum]|uniref:disease resistance protein L6-like n=1 Tax=Syzygium oleosum TaxID=219896 RepID=UPI0024B8A956|nr:disease resistance protein L6-like [Syzygium oleosum]
MQMGVRVPMAVCNYRVFLSFRGPNSRDSFVKYFYDRLRGSGIVAFLDRKEIKYGEKIDNKIVEAIKHSDICIPVFSEDFASSPACLMEVAQMVESDKEIHPVFFGVEPCVVRRQLGTYEKAFAEHERKNRYPGSIEKWKAALREIGDIRGPVFKDLFSGYQELEDFISELWKLLKMDEQDVTKNLVGIDRDMPEMMRKLGFKYQDGQIVKEKEMTGRWVLAVCGLPGVGKTTLAKVVYNKIGHLFEGCSFLENVRDKIEQKSVVSLQKKLIRDLKRGECPKVESSHQGTTIIQHLFKTNRVLIVLDDVDDLKQIKPLAEQLTWFDLGSIIILTTRRKNVIENYCKVQKNKDHEVNVIHEHEVLSMSENHALELFCMHAFGLDHPLEGYHEMSSEITSAIGNLPFVVETVGKYLYWKSKEIWTETLNHLKRGLEEEVERMLKKDFDHLSENAKQIFLDIACFFTGVEKRIPFYMWAACGCDPYRGVGDLQSMSFLKIGEENEFWVHNQLKFLGREIVKKEDKDPGQRSRLWDYNDVQTTLREKKGTSKVEALRVTPNFNQVDGEVFHHLSSLRFLELDNVDIEGNPENLLPKLVWLDWRGCHEKSKLFAFKMENLVILNLCPSSVKLNLEDWKQLMEKAGSLKVLNLKGCTWINSCLEFPASTQLECLVLEGCLLLSPTTQKSISNFENLVSLNMKCCKFVKDLPQALCSMKALKELLIDGTKIERLKFEEGSLPALEILSACKCEALGDVTDSIKLLKNLRKLILRSCKNLKELPAVIGELVSLQEMDLSETLIKELPPSVKYLENLEVLKMVGTYLKGIPEAIKDLKKLKELDFTHCGSLTGHCNIQGLFSLRILRLKYTRISEVLARDEGQFCLHILELADGVTRQTAS